MTSENDIIAIGCDHAAFEAKERLKAFLQMRGFEVKDFGAHSENSVDYPDIAHKLTDSVSSGKAGRGLLLCGTGLGMSYAANRAKGIRAALCWSVETATLSREHNDSNILVLPGRVRTMDPLEDILYAWLTTNFSEDERHGRRISKIDNP